MRLRLVALSLLLCACAGPSVTLDRYLGVYTTHFDGIPDQSRICALVTNQGEMGVEWLRLRLRTHSRYAGRERTWTSYWLYAEPLGPGESAALELEDPPVGAEIELAIQRVGRSGRAPRGRPTRSSPECSQAGLRQAAQRDVKLRTASNVEIRTVRRRGEAPPPILVAAE